MSSNLASSKFQSGLSIACTFTLLLLLALPALADEPNDPFDPFGGNKDPFEGKREDPFGGETPNQETPTQEPAIEESAGVQEEQQGISRIERPLKVRTLRDEKDEVLLAALSLYKYPSLEMLGEIVHRGGPKFKAALEKNLQSLQAEKTELTTREERDLYPINEELLVYSALRRMEKLPDPVPIQIQGDAKQEVIFPEMPVLEVAVINKHPDKKTVTWTEGGNYRHGRRESFSFEVRNEQGQDMPVCMPSLLMGGIVDNVTLKPGEKWSSRLPLHSYMERLPPGKYQVRAAYAFGESIGTIQDKQRTFVCLSDPIELTVKPREIHLPESARIKAEKWIKELKPVQPVKLVEGGYRESVHKEFISPDSPPGQLLRLGWPAVPVLIDSLENEEMEPVKRAWVLGMLYSITGENDPTGTEVLKIFSGEVGILGKAVIAHKGWSALSKSPDGSSVGGFSPASTTEQDFDINEKQQRKFAKKWAAWKSNYLLVEENEPQNP